MAEEYRVDLSALQQVITRLNSLADTMDGIGATAEYKTELPEGYLGRGFTQEVGIRIAHDNMKRSIADMVAELKAMIREVSENTNVVHVGYHSREDEIRESMG